MIWIINSDVQIFQIYTHTTRIPDFQVIGPSENRLKSDMSDFPDFYSSEIRGDRFTDFVFTLPDYREIGSKKSADSKKSGSGTMALHGKQYCYPAKSDNSDYLSHAVHVTSCYFTARWTVPTFLSTSWMLQSPGPDHTADRTMYHCI